MDANEYLKRYLPDFDTDEKRTHLQQFSKEDLIEMLLVAYKNARVIAMTSDLLDNKLARIQSIVQESTMLPSVDQPPSNFPEK